jgi:hypothetical protein
MDKQLNKFGFTSEDYKRYHEKKRAVYNGPVRPDGMTFYEAVLSKEAEISPEIQEWIQEVDA